MSAKAGLEHIVVLNAHLDVVRFDIPYIVFADGDLFTPYPAPLPSSSLSAGRLCLRPQGNIILIKT